MSGPSRDRPNIFHVTLSWLRYPKLPRQLAGSDYLQEMHADCAGHQHSGRLAVPATVHLNPIASCPKRPATDLKCAASMPERRGVRSGTARRVAQVLHAALARPPCINDVSKTEASDEDRRLDEKRKHGIRPLAAPAIFSLPGCDHIMNLDGEKPCYLRKLLWGETAAKIVGASSRTPSCGFATGFAAYDAASPCRRRGKPEPATVNGVFRFLAWLA
jgi:hypothetical protein